ncbi:hypothetical protein TGAM01_v206827 [Trichoderma gamsii]|uniref:Rhodopsin domain-containing protein n=1 Tax=Trichoderma gamsii TaxID=398673 RepID=A0A2K0THS1_9HYPO|nr:hypothetical protein TGAM01_v206827 [Trichoderma gamsii]PNP45070.1 hypothetical protein TGAMA5MH_03119 [Trichoderma gamsii]PON24495.1 hypothetical protein TGAM01_v206827 [Trichoderma gamsii]
MVQPAGDGVQLLYASIVLLVLTWLTFILRMSVRVWRNASGWDDILMFIGLLLFTVTASLCIVCCYLGSGQLAVHLSKSDIMHGTKNFFIAEYFYSSSTVFIKSSIAITLYRIADARRRYKWTIWAVIVATSISAIVFIVGISNICHPITTLWGETTTGTCNLDLNSDVSFFFSAIEIITDWTLAILPAALLWKIQMKPTVKFSVAIILGMGAFASCATIVRLRYLTLYSNPTEFMFGTGKIGLWSVIEEGIGIIAGSLHALRPLLSLPIFGGTSKGGTSGSSSANKFMSSRSGHQDRRADINMDTFQQLGDTDGDGDAESSKHILKETKVTMTRSSRDASPGAYGRSQVLGWKQNNYES